MLDASQIGNAIIAKVATCDSASDAAFSTSPDTHLVIEAGVMMEPAAGLEYWKRVLDLPTGEQSRCHTPRYLIHIDSRDGNSSTIALCWECNNMSVAKNGEYSWQTFDGTSALARSLLADFVALTKSVGTPNGG